ncbi:hypothetical protein SCAR479_08552 [Seiridium cardinale]|uniref:Ubiquitin-like protease family profile domain-containing protein n=1 Tax=Seiridium cardinale TaxID=138064 RepID=A0ABR2XLP1_9PEZI
MENTAQADKKPPKMQTPPILPTTTLVIGNGTNTHHELARAEGVVASIESLDAFLGLNTLQISSDEWLDGSALDVPTEFRLLQQPPDVQGLINLLNTSAGEGLFTAKPQQKSWLDRHEKSVLGPVPRLDFTTIARIRSHMYTFWPVDVGMHWVVATLYMTKAGRSKDFNQVGKVVIFDSEQNEATIDMVLDRLKTILAASDITLAPEADLLPTIWTAKQDDNFSCGLRCYTVMHELMQRITRLYMNGETYDASLWEPMRAWFHAQSVREEMAGLCAAMCVRDLGYEARIAVELAEKIRVPVTERKRKSSGQLISARKLAPSRVKLEAQGFQGGNSGGEHKADGRPQVETQSMNLALRPGKDKRFRRMHKPPCRGGQKGVKTKQRPGTRKKPSASLGHLATTAGKDGVRKNVLLNWESDVL